MTGALIKEVVDGKILGKGAVRQGVQQVAEQRRVVRLPHHVSEGIHLSRHLSANPQVLRRPRCGLTAPLAAATGDRGGHRRLSQSLFRPNLMRPRHSGAAVPVGSGLGSYRDPGRHLNSRAQIYTTRNPRADGL